MRIDDEQEVVDRALSSKVERLCGRGLSFTGCRHVYGTRISVRLDEQEGVGYFGVIEPEMIDEELG